MKFSVLQQNRIVYRNSIQETLLSISSNGLGNKSYFMPVCSIVKLLPLSTCGRPVALLHSASYTNRHEITVYYGEVNYVNSLVPGQLLSTFAISTSLLKYRSRTQCMFQKVCLGHQSASADDKAGNICCQQATQCKYTVRHCNINYIQLSAILAILPSPHMEMVLFCLFLLLYVPCQQLWSLQDGQFT